MRKNVSDNQMTIDFDNPNPVVTPVSAPTPPPAEDVKQEPEEQPQLSTQPTERKNTHNFHNERGKSLFSMYEAERYRNNIAALQVFKQIQEDDRQATDEEKQILSRFSGWGGLGNAFDDLQLRKYLTREEIFNAEESLNSAFFTPVSIVDTLWDVVQAVGFKGGKILEGSAGTGNILAQMPQEISDNSDITTVEKDAVTGGILQLLYPDAETHIKGFEDVSIPNNSIDLAITNVPFITNARVFDPQEKDLSNRFTSIHDFCIAKNVRKLKEGGIGVFITSKNTLDKSVKLCDWLTTEGNTDVIGAFRLHNHTFSNTSVTSDIIVVKKRVNGEKSSMAIDVSESPSAYETTYKDKNKESVVSMRYNTYFQQHPEMMGGQMKFNFEDGSTFRPTSSSCFKLNEFAQQERLEHFVEDLRTRAKSEKITPVVEDNKDEAIELEKAEGKTGQVILNSKKEICTVLDGFAVPITDINQQKVKGYSKQECVADYIKLKNALNNLLEVETSTEDDTLIKEPMQQLNEAYDTFVRKYGNLFQNVSLAWLKKHDVDFPSIVALENPILQVTEGNKKIYNITKTDIFTKRVIGLQTENKPQTIEDALITSIQQTSKVDIPLMQSWLGGTQEQVKNDLLNNKLVFVNPKTLEIEPAYIYLSGNVREKLDYALSHNQDREYTQNIEALKEVVPKTIPVMMINFSLGSTWIDNSLYRDFIKEKFNENVNVTNAGGLWYTSKVPFVSSKNKAEGYYSEECSKSISGLEIFIAAMNNQPVIVQTQKKISKDQTQKITDDKGTRICCAKAEEYKEEFVRWVRSRITIDKTLGERMERVYNDMFNSIVPLKLDEKLYNIPTQGQNVNIDLYQHQKEAIMRGTIAPTMIAHEVGTGKTYTLVSTAMRMKQLGVAQKPMIVVQNGTLAQFTSSAKRLFPNAKILSITDADRTPEGRKMFYAKIKYNDWDMVILPHSVFNMIPDDPKRQRKFIIEKITEAEYVYEMAKLRGEQKDLLKKLESNLVNAEKELLEWEREQEKGGWRMEEDVVTEDDDKTISDRKRQAIRTNNAIAFAKQMLDRKTDDIKSFDDLNIDALLLDEAHEYKRLGFMTALGRGTVKGVDNSYSQQAQGLYLKIQSVFERTGEKNVVLATGTPISNTAAEIYTFMKYLYPQQILKDNGLYYFDDFVHNFGKIIRQLEFGADGKYKEEVRFAAYNNMPELARFWNSIAHTVLQEEARTASGKTLAEAEIPQLKGGKPQDILLEPTKNFCIIMKAVQKKLDEFRQMNGAEKKKFMYIPLVMYNIAARAAIDVRLINPFATDEPDSKTNETVRQTLQALEESKEYNGTVAVFCDYYKHTNKEGAIDFNLYEDIKQKLIQAGMPEHQIAIIPGLSDKKREQVLNEVNAGTIRVVMGTTATLGTGVNIQEKLYTAIHMDCPTRPMDMTQREGRILRQGNLHKQMGKEVKILRMGVKESLDITGYQRLNTKAKFIHSVMSSKKYIDNPFENRVLEDVENNYESLVAALSGSNNFMLLQELKRQKSRLETKKEQIEAGEISRHNAIVENERSIVRETKSKETAERQLQIIDETIGKDKPITFTINGIVCHTEKEKKEAIKQVYKEVSDFQANAEQQGLAFWNADKAKTINVAYNDLKFDLRIYLYRVTKPQEKDGVISMRDTIVRQIKVQSNTLSMEGTSSFSDFRNTLKNIEERIISGVWFKERIEEAEKSIVDLENNLGKIKQVSYVFDGEKQLNELNTHIADLEKVVDKEMKERNARYDEAAAGATIDIDDIMQGLVEMQIIEEELNYDPEATYAVAEALNEAIGKENIQVISDDLALMLRNQNSTDLKTATGTIYGFSNGNKIYLTQYGINAETMIHEYTHLWMSAMEQHNPKGLQSVIDIFKGTPLWEKVIQDENYQNLKSDKEICSEVVARYSGKRGAARLEQEAKQIEKETKGKEKSKTIIQKAKEGLNTFWKFVGTKLFKIKKFTSQEQVADRILFDLLSATNLNLKQNQNQNDTIEFSIRNNLIVPNNKEDYNLLKEKNMTNNVVFPYEEFKYLGVDFSQLSNENLRLLTDGQPTEVLPLEVKYSEGMEKYCKDNDIEYHIEDDTIKFSGRVQLQKYIEVDNTPENKELLQINNINDYTERDNKLNISGDLAKVAQLTMVMMNPVIAFALFLIARHNKIATDNKMLTTDEINHLKEGGIVSKNKMIYQVDKQTNNIVSVSTNSVALPKNIAGQELTPMQKEQLLQGGTIQVKDLNISLDLYERGGLKAVNQKGEQIEFTIKDEKLDPKYLYDLHNANVFDSIPTDANRHEFMQYINEHLQKVEKQGPSTIEKLFPNDLQKQNAFLNHIGLEKEYEQWKGLEGKLDLSIEDKFKKNQIESRFKEAATNKLTQRLQQNESIKRVI